MKNTLYLISNEKITQNNETFKDYTGLIESPLVCDVAGAAIELIWEGSYWRLIA